MDHLKNVSLTEYIDLIVVRIEQMKFVHEQIMFDGPLMMYNNMTRERSEKILELARDIKTLSDLILSLNSFKENK